MKNQTVGLEKKGPKPVDSKGSEEVVDFVGLQGLIALGMLAKDELRGKNRVILGLLVALGVSLAFNIVQKIYEPEPALLGETPDGRIRELPLLTERMYRDDEILDWADKCVRSIYKLSYVDWETSVRNETGCLSDRSRAGFVESLKKVGVLQYLTPNIQGQIHAQTNTAVVRSSRLTPTGYNEWIVEVPYRIVVDGRQKGSLEVVMSMRIRRVSLAWRPSGIWVDEYTVRPKSKGV